MPSPLIPASFRPEIEEIILGALRAVLTRQEESYPYIETKLNIATGENFPEDDPVRGRSVVYNWIQGRGLEALAEHGRWLLQEGGDLLPEHERASLLAAIRTLLERVGTQMEKARALSGGRLPFMMNPDGQSLAPLTPASSMSDLFYAKGLLAAADLLAHPEWKAAAETLFRTVLDDIRSGAFQMGQVAFDPKNPVQNVPGRFTHAGRMIALGGLPLFFRSTGKTIYRETGLEFIEWILANHTSHTTAPPFQAGDFWEFCDTSGAPWLTPSNEIFSDPGHATEFAGLALAHLEACGLASSSPLPARLIPILEQNFANGFNGIGIVKAFDLKERRAINSDMPWWSLPETMRAAALALPYAKPPQQREQLAAVLLQCHAAFKQFYLRPESGMMALQCLHSDGTLAAVIPATPDADPCYHTGLSLIGCLKAINQLQAG